MVASLAALTGCASSHGLVLHEIQYTAVPNIKNKADTEILAFRFGRPDQHGYTEDIATWELSKEHIPQQGQVGGYLEVYSTIWVKWKSKADGQTHEATAEFGDKLPHDMTDCRIFFTTYSNKLTVYLVTTERGNSFTDQDRMPIQAEIFKTVVLFESN